MKPEFIKLAILTASKSQSKFRLGAVLVRKNRVISVGWNDMRKTHPKQYLYAGRPVGFAPGLHAELHATIGVARADLRRGQMYVARIKSNGSVGLARPCLGCQRILESVEIEQVYFTLDNHTVEVLWA